MATKGEDFPPQRIGIPIHLERRFRDHGAPSANLSTSPREDRPSIPSEPIDAGNPTQGSEHADLGAGGESRDPPRSARTRNRSNPRRAWPEPNPNQIDRPLCGSAAITLQGEAELTDQPPFGLAGWEAQAPIPECLVPNSKPVLGRSIGQLAMLTERCRSGGDSPKKSSAFRSTKANRRCPPRSSPRPGRGRIA